METKNGLEVPGELFNAHNMIFLWGGWGVLRDAGSALD